MATTRPTTVQELLDYWPGNIPFKGSLVSEDGTCMCAQGQALHFLDGMSAEQLRDTSQAQADKRVAEIFGISVAHSALLRRINDSQPGAPTNVITNPEQFLGDQFATVLAFWRHLDRMTTADWVAVGGVAWAAAGAAAGKSDEIQRAEIMRKNEQAFFFLPLFGFADPEAVLAADKAFNGEKS